MFQFLKQDATKIIIGLFLILAIVLTFFIFDNRHIGKETEIKNAIKNYVDSCNRSRDARLFIDQLKLDSAKDNKTLIKNEKTVHGLSHAALQHYNDSILRARKR